MDDLEESDANVSYYVSGYIGRSIARRRKCSACKHLLIKDDDLPQLADSVRLEHAHLFEMADHGGLSAPTEFCFIITALAVQQYTAVCSDFTVNSRLMALPNQRCAFTSAAANVGESGSFRKLYIQECTAGHLNSKMIIQTAFNCFAKNELKRLNAPNTAPAAMVDNRKKRKLTGKTSKN